MVAALPHELPVRSVVQVVFRALRFLHGLLEEISNLFGASVGVRRGLLRPLD